MLTDLPHRPLRVLHVRPRLGIGGATEYLIRLAESQAEAGYHVAVASGGGDWLGRIAGFAQSYDRLPLTPYLGASKQTPNIPGLLASGLKLARIIRAERIDIVNTHHRFAALAARLASRLTGVPVVTTLQEVPWRNRNLTRFALGARAITMSAMMKRFVVETCGIAPDRVTVIPIGITIPAPLSDDQRRRLLDELHLNGDAPIVVSVGRLVSRKGHIYLIRALPEVVRRHPDVQVVLVGDGEERSTLEREARMLGVTRNVIFAGARSDAVAIMALAGFTVLPSLEEEFGIVITELFACGKPVVATDVGGIPEHVRPMENGLLVPAGDSQALAERIIVMLDNPDLVRRLGEGGLRTVRQQYTRQRFFERTDAVYRAALRQRQGVVR
ncbi:MAG: glycosyltransferase family 4 protein [Roseiflexaceae bacterium]|nr:glycosyltransferase family 4 protein [Roseiflexaceae bacterium]